MATTRHSLAQFEGTGALFIGGKITSLGVSGINLSSTTGVTGPLAQNTDAQVVRNSIGNYTLTINPFRGPLGGVVPAITAGSVGFSSMNCTTTTAYTNDSLAVTILITGSTGTYADGDVNFMIFAF